MTPAARIEAAIELLTAMESDGRPVDRAVFDYLRGRRYIGSKDRRAISELVYGVLRARARLDWWRARDGQGDGQGQGDGETVEARVRARLLAWLALGEGWPAERLDAAFDGARFAPAPLTEGERRLVRRLESHSLSHPEQPRAVAFELPEWLLARLEESLGARSDAELAALMGEASVDLRVNALKGDVAAAQAALAAEGIETTPGALSPFALSIDGRRPVAATRAFRDGLVEVQDEGSQLVALLIAAQPGERVCDFCAGAGGKTLALAAAMANKGQLIACDTLSGRLDRSAQRLRRAGAHNVTRRVLSSETDPWIKRQRKKFDRVLVDAPCSGSGTWRRNPDARWRLSEAGLAELRDLQARILESAWRLVKPGGRLVYATCSLLIEENEKQVEAFLARHADFEVVPLGEAWAESLGGTPPCEGPFLRLAPAAHRTDGFFVAVLRRRPVEAEETPA